MLEEYSFRALRGMSSLSGRFNLFLYGYESAIWYVVTYVRYLQIGRWWWLIHFIHYWRDRTASHHGSTHFFKFLLTLDKKCWHALGVGIVNWKTLAYYTLVYYAITNTIFYLPYCIPKNISWGLLLYSPLRSYVYWPIGHYWKGSHRKSWIDSTLDFF